MTDLDWMNEQSRGFYSSTFGAWLEGLYEYQLANPEQRDGQAAFNFLYNIRPKMAQEIHCTPLDPFFTDDRFVLTEFFSWVSNNWPYEEVEEE